MIEPGLILAAAGVFLSHVLAPAFVPEVARTFMASGYNGEAGAWLTSQCCRHSLVSFSSS